MPSVSKVAVCRGKERNGERKGGEGGKIKGMGG
jgi:hypothetical protein